MAIYYRKCTNSLTEPVSPAVGDIWVKPVAGTTYQSYIRINDNWITMIGGGAYIAETDADDHYLNVVVQEDNPESFIQVGWIWIKESTGAAYLYLWKFIPIATG